MDVSLGFLLENLKEIYLYQRELIKGAEDEFNGLKDDLDKFCAILEETSRKSVKDKHFQHWESRVREAVYDIEDVIDTCVTEAKSGKKNWFKKTFSVTKSPLALAEQVRTIRQKKVTPLMEDFHKEIGKFTAADETDTTVADARQQKSTHIVGFEKEATEFVERLTQESDHLEILPVYGMPGLGKTTFAWKVYEDETIKFEFPVRIWVNVSQKPNMRKLYLDILSKFTSKKPEESATNVELITEIKAHLQEGKYLIVMDDIWTIDMWNKLKALLPTSNKWGRALITTRNTDVGFAASLQEAHKLRFLTDDESWELLQHQVFSKPDDVQKELTEVGRSIAKDCKGLPLSIVVIGGILQEKTSRSANNNIAIRNEWDEVALSVKSYLASGENNVLGSIISLSYDKLPYKLRNCFLYLGVFPEDANIPVKKLIQLWMAEGLVPDTEGKRTLEQVALMNLKELINRNLVMVRTAKFDGEPKICQIHDTIREICKAEGKKLNLFTEVSNTIPNPDTSKTRRLCIHSHALDFFSKKPKLPKARSFISFNESPMILDGGDTTRITEAFGLLRVYDAKDMKFKIFPAKLVQQLHHLRYITLAIATELNVLPESVTNLWNLQTLIVDTPSSTLEVKGDIWRMRHLRHIKTKASISLSKKGEDDNGGRELQTLTRLSPGSCTYELCKRAKNLLSLGIQGDLRDLGDSKCFAELECLNKLKLVHEVPRGGAADNPLRDLPDSHNFPTKLKILVLSGTRLDWAKMSRLSGIGSLEVLKLKEHAFQGHTWEATGTGFNHLICLDIGRAGLKNWKVSNEHFPKLKLLYINNCENLLEIPITLVRKLEVLSLENVSKGAIRSAKTIVDEELKNGKRVIKLDIAVGDRK